MASALRLPNQPTGYLSPRSTKGSLRLGHLFGIPVFLHWSWFVVAYVEMTTRKSAYATPAWNITEYLALFGIVLLHELGHALACRQVGGKVEKIVLWPLGGVAYIQPPPRPGPVLWSVAAGPLVNLLLIPVSIGAFVLAQRAGWKVTHPDALQLIFNLGVINAGLLLFNMIPVYPLDGGQIVHSILWSFLGRSRSLTIVSFIGLIAGTALVGILFTFGQWWLMFLTLFLVAQALGGLVQADVLSRPGWEHLIPGHAYLAQGDYARAIAECDQAIAGLQDDAGALSMAYLRRAVARQARGEHELAIADANEAVQRAPFTLTLFVRGEIYLLQRRYDDAIRDFTDALQQDGNLALALHQRGDAHVRKGEAELAQADLAAALQLDRSLPDHYRAEDYPAYRQQQLEWAVAICGAMLQVVTVACGEQLQRAVALLQEGRPEEALAEIDQALKLNPQLNQARLLRAETLRQLGRHAEAEADLQQADPSSPCSQLMALALQMEQGNYAGALTTCDAALQADPSQSLLWAIKAEAHAKQGDYTQAALAYTELLRLEPDNIEARYQRGIQYRKLGEFDRAIADYDECLRREPDSSDIYYFRAIAHKARGDYRQAVADYRAALRLNPDNDNYHNNLADLLATCPDPSIREGAEAVRHATRACDLSAWGNAGHLDTLASAYAELSNYTEAVRWQEKALADAEFAARSPRAHERLHRYKAGLLS